MTKDDFRLPNRSRPVRLVDVARAADVSVMTVSNVINGRVNAVGDETARRVRAELQRLNYRPHGGARSLRNAKTYSIGMVIVTDDRAFLAAPFTTHLVAGLSNFLSENSYSLTIQGVRADAFDNSKLFPHVSLDGLCAYVSGNKRKRVEVQARLQEFQLPMVLFQDRVDTAVPDVCSIRQNDRQGGWLLGDLLLSQGARRLLMIRPRLEWPALAEREAGVRDAISAAVSTSLQVVKTASESPEDVFRSLERQFRTHGQPDAVLASNDQIAIATLMYARQNMIGVPASMFITGFNGFEFRQYTEPCITSIRSKAYEIGALGGEVMLHRIRSGAFREPEIVLPVTYLEGGTA